jgi:replication factor C large subunit
MSDESLVNKHRPKTLSSVQGHPSAIKKIKKWAKNWSQGDTPFLLHGPAGTGKTSTAEALSNDMNWAIEEINASSATRKKDIQYLVQSIRSDSMDSERTLFLIDEVDSINGRSLGPLKNILQDAPNPIILTANEKWKVPNGITNNVNLEKFNLQNRSIKPVIRDIAEKENIDISKKEIGQLATRNGLRDAINDLQEYAESGSMGWDERETDIGNFEAVDNLLRGKKYSGEMTPPDMVEWLDQNLPETFDGVEMMRAYQALSEADKFVQKANETQDYSWWKYAGSIAEEVANLRITEPYDWINKSYPQARGNYPDKSSYDNPEATLYTELKEYGEFVGSFSFIEFKNDILPQLKEEDKEELCNFCLTYSLSDKAKKALDITPNKYESWLMQEGETQVEDTESQSEIDEFEENDDKEESDKGIFDF